MRELPRELVEQAAQAMFRSRKVVTADWDDVCRDNPDMAEEVRLLARHAIVAALDYLAKPENVTRQMRDAWRVTWSVPSHEFTAMIAAIGTDE